MNRLPPSDLHSAHDRKPAFLWISLLIFLMVYVGLSIRTAITTPLWMDEVLSVWAARLPSPGTIASALEQGAQYSPPAYSIFLHYYVGFFGQSNLVLRFPSIGAALLTSAFTFVLVRRYLASAAAAFAVCLILETLSPFALQVRPYTIEAACLSAVLLLWDELDSHSRGWREMLIALILAIGVAFHFYAVLFVPVLGVIELLHTLRNRTFRPRLWLALTLAGASIFLWTPIMVANSRSAAEDVRASYRYGLRPTFDSLVGSYSFLIQGLGNLPHLGRLGINGGIVLSTLLLILLWDITTRIARRTSSQPKTSNSRHVSKEKFWEITVGMLSLPAVIFVFAAVGTKAFNVRYTLAGSIGTSALLAEVLNGFPSFRRIVPAAILLAAGWNLTFGVTRIDIFDHTKIYAAIPGTSPIIVADGSQFFQLEYSAPQQFRSRLVYFLVPSGTPVGDATNQHFVERCSRIYPFLPVVDTAFLKSHPDFYVLDERTADDTPANYLLHMQSTVLWKTINGAEIFRSRSLAAADSIPQ